MTEGKVKKKNTVRISQKDLLKLLADNEHMKKQVTELQGRGTELVTENRELKKQLEDLEIQKEILKSQLDLERSFKSSSYDPPPDLYDPNIYIDGSRNF